MPRVRQETIDRISQMGMAKAIKYAHDNDDPEFREAVKRYYPNAKYGPKTEAKVKAANIVDQRAADKEDVAFNKQQSSSSQKPVTSFDQAVARRVTPSKPKKDRSIGGITSIAGIKDPLGYKHKGPRQGFVRGVKMIGRALKPPGAKMWPWSEDKNRKAPKSKGTW